MINDTINPMSFDITKNLHGHVRVETRDRWTGRVVDSQEKDNLVTNAVQMVLQLIPYVSSSANLRCFSPIFQKALGSILLFDGTLTESANNIGFPSNVKLIGAANQSASSDNARGTMSSAESAFTSNGFTTVWNFATSQANGTIASVARTSSEFLYNLLFGDYTSYGISPLWASTYGATLSTSYIQYKGYDETNKYLYFNTAVNQTLDGTTYTTAQLLRAKWDISAFHLYSSLPPASQFTVIKTLTSADGQTNASYWTYDKYANNFVWWGSNKIYKIAIDGTRTETACSLSGVTMSIPCVTKTYYWITATNNRLYRITKANPSEIETISAEGAYYCSPVGEDVVAVRSQTNSAPYRLVYPDGTLGIISNTAPSQAAAQYTPFPCAYGQVQGAGAFISANYLGTIANLDSPVTKTSSQTMKITYTLTEA